MGTNTDQTPKQRKAEARAALDADLNLLPDCDCGEEAMRLIDAYARACIDEAAAPALEAEQALRSAICTGGSYSQILSKLDELRKLLTERAGT